MSSLDRKPQVTALPSRHMKSEIAFPTIHKVGQWFPTLSTLLFNCCAIWCGVLSNVGFETLLNTNKRRIKRNFFTRWENCDVCEYNVPTAAPPCGQTELDKPHITGDFRLFLASVCFNCHTQDHNPEFRRKRGRKMPEWIPRNLKSLKNKNFGG